MLVLVEEEEVCLSTNIRLNGSKNCLFVQIFWPEGEGGIRKKLKEKSDWRMCERIVIVHALVGGLAYCTL